MSTETPNDDAPQPGGDATADAETRALLERLRSAPAEEMITELFSTLLSTAQVKLGRRDARLFIDLCAQAVEHAGPYLSEGLTTQVEAALGQLRLAQVSAEKDVAKRAEAEPNDLARTPAPPQAQAGPADQTASPASKLWVPGR